jgi:hypothetical protein
MSENRFQPIPHSFVNFDANNNIKINSNDQERAGVLNQMIH